MTRYFRSLLEALQGISVSLADVAALLLTMSERTPSEGDVDGRVAALELSRVTWEADLEGLVAKAEGQYRAASNAESRAKTHAKAAEVFEQGDEEGESDVVLAYLRGISGGDEAAGEEAGVPSVPPDVGYAPASPRQIREGKKAQRRAARA